MEIKKGKSQEKTYNGIIVILICRQNYRNTELSSPESKAARRRQRGILMYVEEADDAANDAIWMKSIRY
jgi:hypothetical protein